MAQTECREHCTKSEHRTPGSDGRPRRSLCAACWSSSRTHLSRLVARRVLVAMHRSFGRLHHMVASISSSSRTSAQYERNSVPEVDIVGDLRPARELINLETLVSTSVSATSRSSGCRVHRPSPASNQPAKLRKLVHVPPSVKPACPIRVVTTVGGVARAPCRGGVVRASPPTVLTYTGTCPITNIQKLFVKRLRSPSPRPYHAGLPQRCWLDPAPRRAT